MPSILKEVESEGLRQAIVGFETNRQNRLVIEREVLPIILSQALWAAACVTRRAIGSGILMIPKFMSRNYGLLWATTAKDQDIQSIKEKYLIAWTINNRRGQKSADGMRLRRIL